MSPSKEELYQINNYKKTIKYNNYSKYDEIYFDLDKTIRMYSDSKPIGNSVEQINNLKLKNIKINFITNNLADHKINEKYLKKYKFQYNKLLSPFQNFDISKDENDHGYFIRNNKLYLIKFPTISYKLFDFIEQYKTIHYIDNHYNISSKHLKIKNKEIFLPFVGYFLDIVKSKYNDIKLVCIGKQTMKLKPTNNKNIIMVGDSYQDFIFAKNNNMHFKLITVGITTDINKILDNIIHVN